MYQELTAKYEEASKEIENLKAELISYKEKMCQEVTAKYMKAVEANKEKEKLREYLNAQNEKIREELTA